MAWTTPTTRSVSELITAAIWNADLVDNLLYLYSRPAASYTGVAGGNYTVTSTSYVALDATNLKLTLTTSSGRVLVGVIMNAAADATRSAGFRVNIDSGSSYGYWGDSHQVFVTPNVISFAPLLLTGLSAASHTFQLETKTSAGTMTIYRATAQPVRFWVMEV